MVHLSLSSHELPSLGAESVEQGVCNKLISIKLIKIFRRTYGNLTRPDPASQTDPALGLPVSASPRPQSSRLGHGNISVFSGGIISEL